MDEIQRARLLAAAVATIDERGYVATTVAHITARARVSRRTFYELFQNREECVAAVLQDAAMHALGKLRHIDLQDLAWRERTRLGLAEILGFLDGDRALARVCLVHSLRGGGSVVERREELVAQLVTAVAQGTRAKGSTAGQPNQLTAEGVVGATLAILQSRLTRTPEESLASLLSELMGMIVLPYLGPAAARRERERPVPLQVQSTRPALALPVAQADALANVRMRLTYRTTRVLEGIGTHPGACNREIAAYAGIHDQGQVSKLLARLERLGLLANDGEGQSRGERNAWRLTRSGFAVAQSVLGGIDAAQDGASE